MTNLWSSRIRIGPLCFQAGCRWRRLNLALVFLCLFCVAVDFFWLVNVCFCCVRFTFFHTKPLAWGMSPKWSSLCRVGCKTLTQLIHQCWWKKFDNWLAFSKVMRKNVAPFSKQSILLLWNQLNICACYLCLLLGRLGGVDLITLEWVWNVHLYIRPQKVFPISMKFGL